VFVAGLFLALIGIYHAGTRPHVFVSTWFFVQMDTALIAWGSFGFHDYSWGLLSLVMRRQAYNPNPSTLTVPLGFRDPQRLGTAGDRWGATAVRGLGETVEKETAGKPPSPERRYWLVNGRQ
jgi:Predicted membrane protein